MFGFHLWTVNRTENSKQQQVPNLGYYHDNSYIRKDLLSYKNLL